MKIQCLPYMSYPCIQQVFSHFSVIVLRPVSCNYACVLITPHAMPWRWATVSYGVTLSIQERFFQYYCTCYQRVWNSFVISLIVQSIMLF